MPQAAPQASSGATPTKPGIKPVSFLRYESDFEGFSRDLGESFARYGFAVICDHDLDQKKIDEAISDTKAFFALHEDEKKNYVVGKGGQRGYIPFGIETAKGATQSDLKEFWHVGRELPEGHKYKSVMPDNVWPSNPPGFKEHLLWLYNSLDHLGVRVLQAIANYLHLDRHHFDDTVKDGNSVLRLLHYPPIPEDAQGVRAGAHEDINTITLLLGAEEAGLEVKDRDGEWLAINPPPGSVVCNIGDMLQRNANHVLPSTTHRVVNPPVERRGVPRYSTPFFLHFRPDYEIKTLPGTISAENPDRYPESLTADEFLMQRLREIKLL